MLLATGNQEDPRGARNVLWEMPATLVLSRFIQQTGEKADLELQGLLGGRPAFGRRLMRGEALRLGRVASEEQAKRGGESGRDRCPCPALRAARGLQEVAAGGHSSFTGGGIGEGRRGPEAEAPSRRGRRR